MARLTPGRKAARTLRGRLGPEGMSSIARRAVATREARRGTPPDPLERHLARMAGGAASRARRLGLGCADDLFVVALAMMEAQSRCCALSGVPFSLEVLGHGAAPRPFAPSIDRIDARRGYAADNIRIVCWAVNCLLGTWGDEVARRIAEGIATGRT
jgi:hypothetical protein